MSGVQFEDDGSDNISLNMGGVEAAAGFEVVPKGTYGFIVEKATPKRAKESNNPMILLQLEIEGGDYVGKKLFTNLVFTAKSLPQAKAQMIALGLADLANSSDFNPLDQATADKFVGARAKAKVDIEKYNGEDTNRVKRILALGEGGDGFHD